MRFYSGGVKMENRVFSLKCEIQQYAWGKLGMKSEVAKLSKAINPEFEVKEEERYAELWMGAHIKAPSKIPSKNDLTLLEFIRENKSVLGKNVVEKFNGELPYLFKVLSVDKSLSIQAHPNKKHAELLHSKWPEIYKDPNHKPEMAIALTPFEGLCGFRPLHEIINYIEVVPEFKNVIGKEAAEELAICKDDVASKLQVCFKNVVTCDKTFLKTNVEALHLRLDKMDRLSGTFKSCNGELFLRLYSQFPGDVGCFVIYFLNQVKLQPDEAMFLGANEPHAYLDGNCIECMACSDNVVRAGLTPKLIDAPTLCEMLNYVPDTAESKKFIPKKSDSDPFISIYRPPVDDFALVKIKVPVDETKYTVAAMESASILLVLIGSGHLKHDNQLKIKSGLVLFIACDTTVDLVLDQGGLLAFRALCMI